MQKLDQCQQWLKEHFDLFLDLVRIFVGTGLVVKAFYLMAHTDYLMQLVERSGSWWLAPALVAHYVIVAHMAGGAFLALGLVTRLAALAQVPALAGAVFYVYMPQVMTWEPRQSLEFAGLMLFLLLLISVFGAGRWSLDHYLTMKLAEHSSEPHPHSA